MKALSTFISLLLRILMIFNWSEMLGKLEVFISSFSKLAQAIPKLHDDSNTQVIYKEQISIHNNNHQNSKRMGCRPLPLPPYSK